MSQPIQVTHYLYINGSIDQVFQNIATARGLAQWWASGAAGHMELGAMVELDFGVDYRWQAQVTEMVPPVEIELTFTKADPDWLDTTVKFQLVQLTEAVEVRFWHKGWKEANHHYSVSCYCWAMYLRVLKRFVEHGEFVDYADRLTV